MEYFLKHRHATWLELFFDLVFVSSIGVVTHNLAHTHNNHLTPEQIWLFPLQFIIIWWIWIVHTLFSNRFNHDNRIERIFSLTIMFLMIVMAAFFGDDLFQNYPAFVGFYAVIKLILVFLFFRASNQDRHSVSYARKSGYIILLGTGISAISISLETPLREIVLVSGVLVEMLGIYLVSSRNLEKPKPVHREHMVERIGLLSIILLGESIISLTGTLRNVNWDILSIVAAVTGFIMIGLIWWIYYDSFHVNERIKSMTNGFPMLYSHLFLAMGFVILANVIRHAILNDLNMNEFRILAITGMSFFYIGKQTVYIVFIPPFRKRMTINTLVCIFITIASTFLPKMEYTLVGITIGMLFYTFANFKFILTKDISEYVTKE